jgi:hypothetical protein
MFADTGINWLGICSIVVFYLLILGVGMWAAAKKGGDDMDQEVCFPNYVLYPLLL